MKRLINSIYTNEEDDPLQKQFKTLEIEWDSIKQSISNSDRRKPTTAGYHRLFQLHQKELMSLLQLHNDNSPSREFAANSELHDRASIDDFDGGGIKGRRLFDESDVGSDDYGGIEGGCFDVDEQSVVSTEFSCRVVGNYDENCGQCCGFGCRDPPRSGEEERGGGGGGGRGGSVGRLMICVVVMIALAIVVFKCSCEDEHSLVPT